MAEGPKLDNLEANRNFSMETLIRLKEAVERSGKSPGCDCAVVVTGSFGRLEASQQSDFDYFYLCPTDVVVPSEAYREVVTESVKACGVRPPAADGVFGGVQAFSEMEVIGGEGDSNSKITRRMLFLLEGRELKGDGIQEYRRRLTEKYIADSITDHQLAMFFLNDVIRYYRTICTDYEYKVSSKGKKSWADRNIKLAYSRKLLYFSGVLIAAEAAQQTARRKREIMLELFELTPVERLSRVGNGKEVEALQLYDLFLKKMNDPQIRAALQEYRRDSNDKELDELFREIKNDSHRFSWKLLNFLKSVYNESHPIHKALVL